MDTVLDIMCYRVDTVLDIMHYNVDTVLDMLCYKVYTVLDIMCYNTNTVLHIMYYNVDTVLSIMCYNMDTVLDITVYNVDAVFGYYGLQCDRKGYKLGKFLCYPCMFCHPVLWITAGPRNHTFDNSLCMQVIALFPSRQLTTRLQRYVPLWSRTTLNVIFKLFLVSNNVYRYRHHNVRLK